LLKSAVKVPRRQAISSVIEHANRRDQLAELFTPGAGVIEPSRWLGPDLLRSLAILLVLFGHVTFRMPETTLAYPVIFGIRKMGLVGVDMFYVLSGFLIGGLLLTEHRARGSINIGRFLLRRAWRILPLYWLAILWGWRWYHLIPVSVEDGSHVAPVALWQMWPFFAFVQNYYDVAGHNFGAGAVMQTWTVASLIHFYVFIALLLGALSMAGKSAMRALPWIVAIIFAVCLGFRIHNTPANIDPNHFEAWRNYFPTHLRLDEPMFGVLLAYWVVNCRPQLERFMKNGWPLVFIAAMATFLPAALRQQEGPAFLCIWGFTLAAVGCGGLVLGVWWLENRRRERAAAPFAGRQILKTFSYIGIWSYSIYLWHQPLCQYLGLKVRSVIGDHIVHWSSPFFYLTVVAVYMAMSIGLGMVMYYALEKPLQNLRRKMTLKPAMQSTASTGVANSPGYAPAPTHTPAMSMTR
jgi:peptidoglycan/LPS O-acetylase OafA/YrhL